MLHLKVYLSELAEASFIGNPEEIIKGRLHRAGFDLEKDYESVQEVNHVLYKQRIPYTRFGQFMDRMYRLRNSFTSKHASYPTAVFLGRDEFDLLHMAIQCEVAGTHHSAAQSVMGMEIFETVYDEHLSVGIVQVSE